jgi:hypothetical protein
VRDISVSISNIYGRNKFYLENIHTSLNPYISGINIVVKDILIILQDYQSSRNQIKKGSVNEAEKQRQKSTFQRMGHSIVGTAILLPSLFNTPSSLSKAFESAPYFAWYKDHSFSLF